MTETEDDKSSISSNIRVLSDQEDKNQMEHDDQDIKPEVKNKNIDKPNQSNMPSGSRLISKWIDKEVLYLSLYLIKFLFLKLVFWFLY